MHVVAVAVADANEFLQRHDGVGDHRGARGAAGAEEDIFHRLQRLFIGGCNRALQIRNEAGGTSNGERPVVIGAPVGAHAGADRGLFHLAHPAPGVFDDGAHLRRHRTAFRTQLPRLFLAGRAINYALDAGEEGNGVGVGAGIGNGAALHPAKGGAAVVAVAQQEQVGGDGIGRAALHKLRPREPAARGDDIHAGREGGEVGLECVHAAYARAVLARAQSLGQPQRRNLWITRIRSVKTRGNPVDKSPQCRMD